MRFNTFNYVEEMSHKKKEISDAIDRYHSTISFMITTVVAVLSFGVSSRSAIITYFALIANTLLWQKASFYKNVMAQHSAYCQVFLENEESGFLWETINQIVSDKEKKRTQKTVNSYIEWEAIGMNMISVMLTILLTFFADVDFHIWSVKMLLQKAEEFSWIQISFLVLTIVTFAWSCVKIIRSKNVHQLREYWISQFRELKSECSEKNTKKTQTN